MRWGRWSLAVPAGLLIAAPAAHAQSGGTVRVQLLAFNDFHGNLEPPSGSAGEIDETEAGGVANLATHIKRLEATNPRRTLVVTAGDLIGASPLVSALFHDEPTIEAMNRLGLDMTTVGNHEFDEGSRELLRMQRGGCHADDGCVGGDGFRGADFRFLSSNVRRASTGRTLFPPFAIRQVAGVRVAFVGVTLEGTPQIVTPSGVAGLRFGDEAAAINRLVPRLRRRGVQTIVALVHEGGFPAGGYNACPGISGPITDIVSRTSREVDLFITGHTHQAYNCVLDGRRVTSAASFGRLITDVDLRIDRSTGETRSVRARNRIVTRLVGDDRAETRLVRRYVRLARPVANRVIGRTAAPITRDATPAGESALGDVIADGQLAATSGSGVGGAQIALMNPGGIRADLPAGDVTYNAAFTVQPFGNSLVTMTLTGAQIEQVLEQQVWPTTDDEGTVLQVSAGFRYSWSAARPAGDRVDPASISLNGVPVSPTGRYRVTVNSFLADGGDDFTVLRQGTERLGGDVDLDAFEAYVRARSPVAPGPRDRIAKTG